MDRKQSNFNQIQSKITWNIQKWSKSKESDWKWTENNQISIKFNQKSLETFKIDRNLMNLTEKGLKTIKFQSNYDRTQKSN